MQGINEPLEDVGDVILFLGAQALGPKIARARLTTLPSSRRWPLEPLPWSLSQTESAMGLCDLIHEFPFLKIRFP